jgi:hypothetical protein
MNFGFKAGLGATTFTGDQDTEFQWQGGVITGITFELPIAEDWKLQVEGLYATKGSNARTTLSLPEIEVQDVPVDVEFDVSYIEIPTVIKWKPIQGKRIRPTLHAGPMMGWNVSATVQINAVGETIRFVNEDESIKKLDVGAVIGIGVETDIGWQTLSLEVRYTHGLTNLIENDEDPKYNGSVGFTLGITL